MPPVAEQLKEMGRLEASEYMTKTFRRPCTPQEIMDLSMTQTLERTLLTSVCTLLVVVGLFLLGGDVLHNFSIVLMVGIVFGTYSSVYVASGLALELGIRREDLLPPVKDEREFDGQP